MDCSVVHGLRQEIAALHRRIELLEQRNETNLVNGRGRLSKVEDSARELRESRDEWKSRAIEGGYGRFNDENERLRRQNERLLDALELIAENGSGGPELDWVEFAAEIVHIIKYREEETWEQST